MAEIHAILVQQVFFAATGVSDGDLLRGVRYFSGGASTNSIVMRASSGTGQRLTHVLHAPCCHIKSLSVCFGRPIVTSMPAACVLGIAIPLPQLVLLKIDICACQLDQPKRAGHAGCSMCHGSTAPSDHLMH